MPIVVCMICGESVCVDARSGRGDVGRTYKQLVTEVSDISGRSLRQMISTVFPQDLEIQQFLHQSTRNGIGIQNEFSQSITNHGMCGACYNLLEQVTKARNIEFRDKIKFIHRYVKFL